MFKNNALFTILFNNDGLSLHGFKALLYSLPFTLGIALRCKEGLLTSVPQASPSVLRRCAKRCFAILQPTSSIAFGLAAMCEASLHFITWLLRAQPFVLRPCVKLSLHFFYMVSGAETPSNSKPLCRTCCTLIESNKRA